MPDPGENIQSWSTTALDNGNADSLIVFPEGQTRASVNNSARSMMAAHAKDRNLNNGSIVTTGTADAHAFISGVGYTAVPTGLKAKLKIGTALTNTGAATLNMDSIGDVAILDLRGNPLQGGELLAGSYCDFLYNGTNWILLNSIASITQVLITNISNTVISAGGTGSATVEITDLDATYDHYQIDVINLLPSLDGNYIGMQIGTGDPPTWKTSVGTYDGTCFGSGPNGGGAEGSATTGVTDRMVFTFVGSPVGNAFGAGCSYMINFQKPADATLHPTFDWRGRYITATNFIISVDGAGRHKALTAFTAIRFLAAVGNIASGTINVWGIRKPE